MTPLEMPLLGHELPKPTKQDFRSYAVSSLGYALFATRWLQAPLYFGLVAAQGVYVYKFFNELCRLVLHVVGGNVNETHVMLAVLKLVDVVMIANLLIMVIVGGYETFVSRIGLQNHRDQPEWLSHVNSNVLKVKLATAIVGISSVHLLQMFVDVDHTSHHSLLWGTVIHMAFIVSAAILAYMSGPMESHGVGHGVGRRGRSAARPPLSETGPETDQETEPETEPRAERRAEPEMGQPATGHSTTGHGTSTSTITGTGTGTTGAPVPRDLIPAQNTGPVRESGDPRGSETRIRAAGFPARKSLEEFDREHQRSLDWETVARLGKADFVPDHGNAVLLGPPGTGKTHLAVALGIRACQAGHQVRFATAAEWLTLLSDARSAGRLKEELAQLDRYDLVIVDEIGYVDLDREAADLLFRFVSHRYERASIMVTGDKPLSRWNEVFGDTPVVSALIDRLVHHAEVLTLTGSSYRLRGRDLDRVPATATDIH
ncbi:IS21-like element helper ATPase IstB [Streptomyces sp. NPDC020965]|uniref:IS21-like element helper ATPase IstB n=1 Tax=Streptomyces sp. NPDC020965 TaxID=3365105 RepID=UPI00379659C8